MKVVYGRGNKQYCLEDLPFGSGGEGEIYEIIGDGDRVAKLYYRDGQHHTPQQLEQIKRKLEVMIGIPIRSRVDGILCLAWPEDIIFENGVFVGFIMPRVRLPYKIYQIARGDRMQIFPDYTWKYSVQYAYNLAWVIWYLHMNGIVVGDLNMNNIMVGIKGEVALIDCDSFDIHDPVTGEHFKCNVGLEELIAPEVQMTKSVGGKNYSKESDCFTLGIHIFRLLMDNADPFCARVLAQNIPSKSVADAYNVPIINGECPYFRPVTGKVVPDWAPPLDFLPSDIISAFDRTFNYTQATVVRCMKKRTTAEEWARLLWKYGSKEPNPNLQICSADRHHVYPVHNTLCPFCTARRKR